MSFKGEIPFLRLIIPLIVGILAGYYFSNGRLYNLTPLFGLIAVLSLGFLTLSYKKFLFYKIKGIIGLVCHGFLIAVGYWLTVSTSEVYDETYYALQSADALIVEINSEPKVSGDISRFEARVIASYVDGSNRAATGKLMVSIKADTPKTMIVKYGDQLLIPGKFDRIEPPYNPGEFNYKAYLSDRQIYYQTFIGESESFVAERDAGNRCISFALELRKQLVDKFHKYLPDKNAAAFSSTLILGYRAELSKELIEAYSKTGTMHVLSVSGMHVGIIFMVLSVILKFMDKTKITRLIRALVIIAIIWFYALITGFSAPACRAALMLSFIVLGKALNKHQNTYNLIAISAFFLLLYNPFYLVDIGFQLSYLAVVGIVYFHPKIYKAIYVKNKLLDHVWSYSALSLAAQVATFPVSIYYFHQFPIYFLFSNLLIVIPVAIIMYSGILFMFIPFTFVLHYTGKFLSSLIISTNDILYFIENLPFSSWNGIWINSSECIAIFLLIVFISLRLDLNYKRLDWLIVALTIFLSSSFSWTWIRNYDQRQIVFYNLKRKSGIAFIHHGRSIVVSDVDPSDKLVKFSILPVVKSKGSSRETFYTEMDTFSEKLCFGNRNYYQFGTYKILKWSKDFDNTKFVNKINVTAVLISGNPRVSLDQIASSVNFERIIIDANNADYKIDRWIVEAQTIGCKFYVLKKNPALVINL